MVPRGASGVPVAGPPRRHVLRIGPPAQRDEGGVGRRVEVPRGEPARLQGRHPQSSRLR